VKRALALSTLLWCGPATAVGVPEVVPSPACVACQVDGERMRRDYSHEAWTALTAGEVVTSEMTDKASSEDEVDRRSRQP
jgi:hypothetical protein